VSSFVDQQKIVRPSVVDAVARDFDLSTDAASAAMTPANPNPASEKFDVAEALKTLATLADRLRQSEPDLPKERKI
jgi:hypothetical protein